MKIGLIGLPQSGKKTLFELLTNHTPSENEIVSKKPIKGIAEVKDPRFDRLVSMYKPKKQARARVDVELLPKIEKDSIASGDFFKDIIDSDAICHVVRAFKDDSIYHVDGTVDPKRDISNVNSELILNDLIFIEKRIERIEKATKRTSDSLAIKEKEILLKLKSYLDKEMPLRIIELNTEEKKLVANYPFITIKEMIIALNVSEEMLSDNALLDELKKEYESKKINLMHVSAKVEKEIAALDSEKEREDFLKAVGITEPAINMLTQLCIKALNLISFFTVGSDEVKQWPVRSGSSAPEAAGAIHTDIQKGFIRAELIKYNDLIQYGNEEKVKEAGKFYLKGKDYIVDDGDILSFRFSV